MASDVTFPYIVRLLASRCASRGPFKKKSLCEGQTLKGGEVSEKAMSEALVLEQIIQVARTFAPPLFFRLVNLICSLALGFFALKLLLNTIILLKG